jgi:demethylmenaquinone methyltransferase/2-methoxy-6-polyprenyl-1,4-benzoquinol methylase
MPQSGENTHFGFQQVALGDKQARVDDVFHSVARRYDLMNDLMSGGLHRAWKSTLVSALNPPKARGSSIGSAALDSRPFALLDLAGGTGDVAFRAIDAGGADLQVTVVDINADMLDVGRTRAQPSAGSTTRSRCRR